MAKNELRHIHFLLVVHHDWYALTIIPDDNTATLCIDSHLDLGHLLVTVEVIGRVHDDLI